MKHLTAASRRAIEALLKQDCTLKEISDELGVHKSTVSREIKNRGTPKGYFADIAQLNYEQKREKCGAKKKLSKSKTQSYVIGRLKVGWSPEEISGRMKLLGREDVVSYETIYKFIYEDKQSKEKKLYQYLRYGRKKRKKQNGRRVHKDKIPNKVSIHQRPKTVEKRTEVGHWEGDSVIYEHKYAINTLNELKTGLVVFTKLVRKTAKQTATAMTNRLNQYISKTVTVDNGSEFTYHEKVTRQTGVSVYFCDPYSSWQRGANENCNMLLRGFLPKKSDISCLSQYELDEIANELNNRPRKRLNFFTPLEVYNKEIAKLNTKGSHSVAFDS